jgi:hypothetical protein
MDIGEPYKDLGPIDVTAASDHVRAIPEASWTQNTFRQDVLADHVHSATRAIIFRHEWARWDNPWRVNTIEELIQKWAVAKGIDATRYMPVEKQETDAGPIYTFREWLDHRGALQPVMDEAIDYLRTERGIVTRLALVWLQPGAVIAPHRDGQDMATLAHRLHVPLITPPGVEYKVGGKKFAMRTGRVYDFNNRLRHSVRHRGRSPRVNMFIDYYPNPAAYVPPPYGHH